MPTASVLTATDVDVVYTHRNMTVCLRESAYRRSSVATRIDDGIIDDVAVDRFIAGHHPVPPLSGREVVCVVARLIAAGESDQAIADRFGTDKGWTAEVRNRNGIPAAETIAEARA